MPRSRLPRRRREPPSCRTTGMQKCKRWTGTSTPGVAPASLAGRLRRGTSAWHTAWLRRLNQPSPSLPRNPTSGRPGGTGPQGLQSCPSHVFRVVLIRRSTNTLLPVQ
eukprot:1837240-Amphidinium_carterae.1